MVTDPSQWRPIDLEFDTDYTIHYKKYSSSEKFDFKELGDNDQLDFEMGQCYTLEYRLDATKFAKVEESIKTQTIIISHEDPTKMYIPPSSTEYKRDKYRVTGSDLQNTRRP